jgi:hypothetical protein
VVVTWPNEGHERGEAVTITEGNMKRLGGQEHLEDSVIDIYLKYLHLHKLQQLNRRADPRDIFVCSSHLYTHLRGKRGVSRWLKRVDICSKRFIFVPINRVRREEAERERAGRSWQREKDRRAGEGEKRSGQHGSGGKRREAGGRRSRGS